MIAKIPPGRADGRSSVASLNAYILSGRNTERCEYAACKNLLSLELATTEMESTAFANARSANPFLHCILSWREGESPTSAQVDEAVGIALSELGLEECQCLYGLHRNTDNLHVHLCVNRVHPESGRVLRANGGWTKKGLERAARRIEFVQGWEIERSGRYVVFENGEISELDGRERRIGARARDVSNVTGEKSAERIARELEPLLAGAGTWEELHRALAPHGVRMEARGSGAIFVVNVSGEEIRVKASAAGRNCSRGALEARLGPFEPSARPVTPRAPEALDARFPSWRTYAAERAMWNAARTAETKALVERHRTEKAAFDERRARERKELFASRAQRRGSDRNAERSLLAARHARERAVLLERQREERRGIRERHPPFPGFENWLRLRRDFGTAEEWRYRWSREMRIRDGKEGEEEAARAPRAVDLRDFVGVQEGGLVAYVRRCGGEASFRDYGREIGIRADESAEGGAVLAALQLAAMKWRVVVLDGTDEYKDFAARVATRHGIAVSNPELREVIRMEREAMERERIESSGRKGEESSRSSEPCGEAPRLRAFEEYHRAVRAERYRVTAIRMELDGTRRARVLDRDGSGATSGFEPEELRGRMRQMSLLAARGENLYYTPLSASCHFVLVDDMSAESLKRLRQDGYRPAVVLESSPGNFQALLRVPREGAAEDRDAGNRLAASLNREYGDPKLSGCVHPHRAPGFENRKPSRRREDGTYPEVRIVEAEACDCDKARADAREIAATLRQESARKARTRKDLARSFESGPCTDTDSAYLAHWRDLLGRYGTDTDKSRIDGMIAVRLRVTGHTEAEISGAVERCAPTIRGDEDAGRRRNWKDYATRTARYAFGPGGDRQVGAFGKYERMWRKIEGEERHRAGNGRKRGKESPGR